MSDRAEEIVEEVRENHDEKCIRVDKGDGRISWLYSPNGQHIRSYSKEVTTINPIIAFRDIQLLVSDEVSYEAEVVPRSKMPD